MRPGSGAICSSNRGPCKARNRQIDSMEWQCQVHFVSPKWKWDELVCLRARISKSEWFCWNNIIWVVIFGSLSSKIQRKGIPSLKPIPTMKRLSKSSSNPLPKKKSTAPQKPQKTAKTIHQLSTTLHKYHLSQKKGINAPAENHLQRPRTGPWPSAGRTSSRSETARAPDGSESSDSG